MTLDDAILHCKEIIENNQTCKECKDEHQQLLEWLLELKAYRQLFNTRKDAYKLFGEMRDLTEEERIAYNKYIESISIPTGINFWDYIDKKEK